MADYSSRTVTKTWFEYTLPNPTNWVEVRKVVTAITHNLEARGLSPSDDRVEVIGLDEEIVFRFEIKSTSAGAS
jgi:hypothetical protein